MRQGALIVSAAAAAMLALPAFAADDAIPDFSGIWVRNSFDAERMPSGSAPLTNLKRLKDGTVDGTQLVGDYNNPILKPEAAAIVKQKGEISIKGIAFPDPSNHCAPYTPPYIFTLQLGLMMLQEKDQITILYNQDDQVRRVRMNSAHPEHVTPSAMGDSVGYYLGDSLVIDTVGIKTGPLVMADRYGSPQSEALHLVERYRIVDAAEAKAGADRHEKSAGRIGGGGGAMPIDLAHGKGLQLQFTVDDPTYFTAPWSAQVNYLRSRVEWQEQVCAENFREYYFNQNTAIPQADKPDF